MGKIRLEPQGAGPLCVARLMAHWGWVRRSHRGTAVGIGWPFVPICLGLPSFQFWISHVLGTAPPLTTPDSRSPSVGDVLLQPPSSSHHNQGRCLRMPQNNFSPSTQTSLPSTCPQEREKAPECNLHPIHFLNKNLTSPYLICNIAQPLTLLISFPLLGFFLCVFNSMKFFSFCHIGNVCNYCVYFLLSVSHYSRMWAPWGQGSLTIFDFQRIAFFCNIISP